MSRRGLSLWALAVLCALAPARADGNIGCLFSTSLCVEGAEWCYDDFAFGKCIPIYEDQPDEGSLYQYDMSRGQLSWFEAALQRLLARGYRWEHAYTQCALQAMLYTMKEDMDPERVNMNICKQFADPKLEIIADDDTAEENVEVDPEETAYVRFTPNTRAETDFANEVYSPPDPPAGDLAGGLETPRGPREHNQMQVLLEEAGGARDEETPSEQLRDIILQEAPAGIMPFEGFRERIREQNTKEKKSLPTEEDSLIDEDRLTAHYRKLKTKPPVQLMPYTAEYLTGNRFSPIDEGVRVNALEKYKQSFAEKNFPFEYENPDNEIPEPRIYIDEDLDSFAFDAGSGEVDRNYYKDTQKPQDYNSANMQYLMNYWKSNIEPKLKPADALYSEGGAVKVPELTGENYFYPEELRGLLYNEWGFKRRERDDVKKPGPRLDAKTIKSLFLRNESEYGSNSQKLLGRAGEHNHNDFKHDPSYTYVLFKNRFGTDWSKGLQFIAAAAAALGLPGGTLTHPRVDANEVTFKVGANSKGWDAADVARKIDEIKDQLRAETGAIVVATGVGDRSKLPLIQHAPPPLILGMDKMVVVALLGAVLVLLLGVFAYVAVLYRDQRARKARGLHGAGDVDAEATRDYQELCRARMSGKWSTPAAPAPLPPAAEPPRVAALARDAEHAAPSARSSTSSWSEEPALTNMDISTGHMVLAYMEDHLRNKDRLDEEWRGLCSYEAEPSETTAARLPQNYYKNRGEVLPYDHARVSLNPLSNHLGSDYINASTITDHDPRNPAYIAAAGPLAQTAPDFWQLVWEQGSVVTVMLTRLTENGQQLCHRYWPEEGAELYHIYEVHLVSEHIWCDDYLVRSFYLKNQRTGETRTVTQFHFLSWPENGVPASTKALLEFRRKVNKSYRGRSCPIIVHCSDGAGRTGTYCLIDMVLNRMAKGAKEIDIAATLEHIRDQRARTVASRAQFEFVLMAVAEEVHAILKALPAHLQQLQEKKEKEKEKEANEKEKPNN